MPIRIVSSYDHRGVVRLNSLCAAPAMTRFALFMANAGSFLGCILAWSCLIAIEPSLALPLVLSGVLGLLVFKLIKHTLRRPRPFARHQKIVLRGVPPDVFSFPSGHALHAASIATIVCLTWTWAWPLGVVWYLAMAASRIMLGLHYPTDVLLGGMLGALLGYFCWVVV